MKSKAALFLFLAILAAGQLAGEPVTYPLISEETIRVEELRVDENAFAAVRRPPSQGRLPAVIFLHGGLGHSTMDGLRQNSVRQPT